MPLRAEIEGARSLSVAASADQGQTAARKSPRGKKAREKKRRNRFSMSAFCDVISVAIFTVCVKPFLFHMFMAMTHGRSEVRLSSVMRMTFCSASCAAHGKEGILAQTILAQDPDFGSRNLLQASGGVATVGEGIARAQYCRFWRACRNGAGGATRPLLPPCLLRHPSRGPAARVWPTRP